jgi:CBS-domain-containing membrane protein
MNATTKPLLSLTAADLMSRDVVALPRNMSLRAAGHLLSEARVSGAPIVDQAGVCVGVLSATDFMVHVGYGEREVCHTGAFNPGCYHSPWQVADLDELPSDEVGDLMTADPVMVPPSEPLADLARRMIDAHIHRIIVVNAAKQPIGVVSSTDILAAVANYTHRVP